MSEKILFKTALDGQETTDVEGIGTIRRDEYGNVYKWVQNGEASTVTATLNGHATYESTTRNVAHIPTTANLKNGAGFWMAAVVGQSYGWIQCKGTGPGLVIRSGAASSDTVASSAAHLSNYIGVNGQEYVSQSNAIGLYDPIRSPISLASLATTAVGTASHTLVFDFKL